SRQVLRLIIFEIEVERNDRPIPMVAVPQSLLYDRPHPLEEILIHGWFVAVSRFSMCDHRPAASGLGISMPGQVLLDSHGSARRKSTINAVAPPFKVGIAVVRIHHRACTRMQLLRAQRTTTDQESQGKTSHRLFLRKIYIQRTT